MAPPSQVREKSTSTQNVQMQDSEGNQKSGAKMNTERRIYFRHRCGDGRTLVMLGIGDLYAVEYVGDGGDTTSREVTSENAIEVWAHYQSSMDTDIRRRLGDVMEAAGRDRWTGLPEKGEMQNGGKSPN